MYSDERLTEEIKAAFGHLESAAGMAPKSWLIRSVMANHPGIEGEDADFASHCAEGYVTVKVETFFRKRKASETDLDNGQLELEGMEYVKKSYLTTRNGEIVSVPVLLMTYEERARKVEELRAHGRGTFSHADELERLNEALRAQESA